MSEAVGSSRISTDGCVRKALAISTICCSRARQVLNGLRRVERKAQPRQDRLGLAPHRLPVEKPVPARLGAQEEVLLRR